MNRRAIVLALAAVLSAIGSPAFAKAKPITALAPVEIVLDGQHELVGVAVAPDDSVYVSDRKAGRVLRLAPSGQLTVAAHGLEEPRGLATTGAGLLIAETKAGRVLRLEPSGALTILASGIRNPRALAAAPDGTIYIAARGLALAGREDNDEEDDDQDDEGDDHDVILHRDPATGALTVVAAQLRKLEDLALNGLFLYAAARRVDGLALVQGAIVRYPVLPDGRLSVPRYFLASGFEDRPKGLALDRLGALYVSSKEIRIGGAQATRALGKVHPNAHLTEFARELDDPQGLALGADGSLYVADGDGGRLIRFRAPPVPTLAGLSEFTQHSPLTVTGTAEAQARVDLFLNDAATAFTTVATGTGTFTLSVPLALDAANTLEVFATARGGNGLTSAAVEVTVKHDDVAPNLLFLAPPALAHVRQSVVIQAEATDGGSGIAALTVSAGSQPLTAPLAPTPPAPTVRARAPWDTTTVADGAVGLRATATDRAGNTATLTRSVIVDNAPPVITLTDGPAEGAVTSANVTFAFAVSDNLTAAPDLGVTLRLDGVPVAGAASPVTLTGLLTGPHIFSITARDRAGNEATVTRGFTVSVGPAISTVEPASGPIGTLVTITGTSFEPGATVTFNGLAAVIRTLSATTITTTVPVGATTGLLVVTTSHGTASRTFTVGTTGDFTLTAAPGTARAVAGDQTSVTLAAGGSGSFTSLVSLTVSTPAGGITAGFSPSNLVAPGASAFVNVALASTVTPGSYGFTVSGQAQVDGRSVTRTAAFTLVVLAPDTTAITGRVLTAEAVPQPIPGVTVTVGSAFTLTDAGGNFVLLAPPAGANMLLVDGRTASTPTTQYPPVEVNIAVNSSGPTRVPFVVYLPKLDTANPVSLPTDTTGTVTQTVQATTPTIPGLVVTIPAGTRITGPDGNPVSQITITPVPIDRSPMPFPAGVAFPTLFTIQPGGAVPSQPLPITFPNIRNASPGSKADLWFFDLAAGTWKTWGTGTVSSDGTTIVSDPGFGLPRFAWHSYCDEVCQLPSASEAPPAENQPGATGGEPVDLFTGRFVVRKTDLVLPGRIPVRIERTYWSGLSRVSFFGIGWNLADYDLRLATRGTSLALIQPDQSQLLFAPDGAGRWVNHSAPYMQGAVITQLPGDFIFQLRLKDGTVQRFDRIVGFANVAALAAVSDRNGNTVTITREGSSPSSFGQITRITEPAGRAFTLAYDAANRIVSVTDPINRIVRYTYDAQGRLETVTDPAGGVTRYTYDASHRVLTITDPRAITFLTNEYDATGRVTRQTQADGGVWQFAYALEGTLVTQTTVTDPRGNPTTHRFNGLGFTVSTTDALGQTTAFEYAAGSNLLLATTDPLGRVTRFTYDVQGNVTTITDPAGNVRRFTYEPTFNKIASVRDPLGNITRFAYDAQGNLTSVTDPLGKVTALTSNAFGQPLTTTDPLTNPTTFTYNAQGNLATVADPLGNTTTRQYDAGSRLARQTDPRGKPTAFAYDPLNRVTAISDPLGGATRFTYDGNGNLLTVADPQGNTTTYTYDAMDRVVTRADPLGHTESFTYDPAGNLTGLTDRKGQTATFGYDALNRRTGATYIDATVTSTYDAVGRLTRVTDSAGGTITSAYDTLDRLVSQTAALGTVGYTYDGLGRRTTMIVPGQPEISYAYDPASRLTSITQGSSLVQFAYDAASRRTTLTLPNGVTTQYGYDSASRLTALTYTLAATVLGDLQYTYDAAGNRTGVAGSWARTSLPQPVAAASYNANNQQFTFGGQTLAYDLNGNLTNDGTNTYAWTARNQLATIRGPAPASFVYDGIGRRMRKAINGTITDFLYDGVNPIQEVSGAAAATLLTGLGIDEYLMRADTSGSSALLTDALGSTVAVTDPAGAVQTQYTYEPFGQTVTTGAASSSPFQYTGRESDGTGLYYYRARYYYPGRARFISEDPARLHGAETNFFVYVANNPINFIDPLGLDKEKKCEDLFPPGLEWLKYYLTAEKTLTPFVVGNASILAGSAVAAGGAVATGALVAAAPETLGLSLVAVPGTLLVVAAGEYLVVFGTDVNIGQVNSLFGTKIPRPHDVAPKAFPGFPSGKLCR